MPVKIVGRQTVFSLNGFWRIVKQFQRNLFNYYVYKVQNARMGALKSWFAATKLIPSASIERKNSIIFKFWQFTQNWIVIFVTKSFKNG